MLSSIREKRPFLSEKRDLKVWKTDLVLKLSVIF